MTDDLDTTLQRVFSPVDKRAFGLATGVVSGLLIFAVTAAALVLDPGGEVPLALLAQYFAGYSVSVPGAFVGAAWGVFVGFIAGWFTAFVRNLSVATWRFVILARADLKASRDFLDHI
ncbi:MAG: hypothetical protein WD960_00880 [Gemmatimonadota bacterium]